VEVKQSRERLGTLEAVAGGFILSVLLSAFLFFFVHGWAVLFFLAFLAACLAYSLCNPKPKPGVSVVMVATPYRKIYAAKAQGSYEESRYRLAKARLSRLGNDYELTEKGLKFIDPDAIIAGATNLGSDLHIRLMKKAIEKLHEDNMLVVAPKESDAPDLVAYPVDKKAKKKYMWDDKNRRAYEIQTNARKDSILANVKKKEKYNIYITGVTYSESILEEIKKITEGKDEYLVIRV
jgi:hypothetical protein